MSLEVDFATLASAGALMEPDECKALWWHAGSVPREQEIVEVGSWAGGSAAWLGAGSRAGRGAHITCVDIWEDWIDPPEGQEITTGAGALERFFQVTDPELTLALRAPSLEVARIWTRPIGLLFIDAWHTFEGAASDYEAWSPFVVQGGVLAVHDYLPNPSAEDAARYWWTEGPTRAVDEVIASSGLWDPVEVVDFSWIGRRR